MSGSPTSPRSARLVGAGVAVLLIGGAFALYQPAMRIGLLSDDYALLMWARQLELAPRDWGQIRPLPIIAWWLLARITTVSGTPAALHALNIGVHGLNATLVFVLARRFLAAPWGPAGAAALFLTMPIAVEPVAWGSGVFDLTLTTFTLLLAIIATSRRDLRTIEYALGLALTVAMMGAKETGVIAGPLVVLLYWARWGRLSRGVLTLGGLQLLLAGSYTLARELTDRLDHRLVPRPDASGIGRLLSGVLRAFFLPLHRRVVEAHPVMAMMVTLVLVAVIVAWVFRWRQIPNGRRLAVLASVGTLLCVAPAIRLFGITPDLQGTRYVYLAGAWWSIALASALLDGWTSGSRRTAAATITICTVVGAAIATRVHLQPWTAARVARDKVLLQLISLPPSCRQASADGVPDNVSGAYVFRNGLNEALATLGRSYEWVDANRADDACRMTAVY